MYVHSPLLYPIASSWKQAWNALHYHPKCGHGIESSPLRILHTDTGPGKFYQNNHLEVLRLRLLSSFRKLTPLFFVNVWYLICLQCWSNTTREVCGKQCKSCQVSPSSPSTNNCSCSMTILPCTAWVWARTQSPSHIELSLWMLLHPPFSHGTLCPWVPHLVLSGICLLQICNKWTLKFPIPAGGHGQISCEELEIPPHLYAAGGSKGGVLSERNHGDRSQLLWKSINALLHPKDRAASKRFLS